MRTRHLLIAACLSTAIVVPPCAAQDATAIRELLDHIRDETGAPGVSAAVAVHGRLVFSGGVGVAELDNMTPADGRTVHNVGSVSKVESAVAVMQLVEQGKVGLDEVIQKYVPSYPVKSAPITLRHVLTHGSGIRHYKDGEFGPDGLLEMRRHTSIDTAIDVFRDDPLLFAPGTLWSYSSHAFNLLQGVIEKASGLGFEAYMRRYVWEPAGMVSSSFDVPERVVHRRGWGYERTARGVIQKAAYADVSYKYASGGMLASCEDLVRFAAAINAGTLMKAETRQAMHAVQVETVMAYQAKGAPVKQDFKQALAWRVSRDVTGRTYISHTGTVRGTRSVVINYPAEGVVVAMQANILPFDSEAHGRALALLVLSTPGAPE